MSDEEILRAAGAADDLTRAVLLHLQERGYAPRLYDGWHIRVVTFGACSSPSVCIRGNQIEIHLDNQVEYIDLADPDCFKILVGWIAGADACRNSGQKVQNLRDGAPVF